MAEEGVLDPSSEHISFGIVNDVLDLTIKDTSESVSSSSSNPKLFACPETNIALKGTATIEGILNLLKL